MTCGVEMRLENYLRIAAGLRRVTFCAAVAALAVGSGISGVSAETPVPFAPHRAVYDITLLKSAPGSGVSDLNGRMVYELSGNSCEGYTQNMRFVTRMTNQEGTVQLNDLRTSSFEQTDGRRLRFNSSQYLNDSLVEAAQGDASRTKAGEKAKVRIEKPERKEISLAADVYFPMQHMLALMAAARDGKTIFQTDLFDGSEKGDKVYATSAVIGTKATSGAIKMPASVKEAVRIEQTASWPVSISYFEKGTEKTDAIPNYELSFRLFENGVTSKLDIDYGEFAISGTLTDVTFLEVGKCVPSQP